MAAAWAPRLRRGPLFPRGTRLWSAMKKNWIRPKLRDLGPVAPGGLTTPLITSAPAATATVSDEPVRANPLPFRMTITQAPSRVRFG